MDNQVRGIITLIRSGLTGEKLALPEKFDLAAAFEVLKKHGIVALAYEGAVRCGLAANEPVMLKMLRLSGMNMLRSEAQMAAVERICAAFEENGIDYMPLKGSRLKKLYPKPELRMMGDADILIRMEQYGAIRTVMEKLGFKEDMVTDHELVWISDDLFLELHKRLIPSYNKDFYGYFGDGWKLAKPVAGHRYGLGTEDELIYLFTHFAKHYRDGGIGLRHVTDLWVYRQTYPGMDEGYVRRELEKLQLLEFYENVQRVLGCWFEDGAQDEKTGLITEFIFVSGSWGAWENRVRSIEVKMAKETEGVESRRSDAIRMLLFPGVDWMSRRYPVLKKAPWLLPVFWVVRGITAVLFRRENVKYNRKLLDAKSVEEIENHRQALQFVGLDFNFEAEEES